MRFVQLYVPLYECFIPQTALPSMLYSYHIILLVMVQRHICAITIKGTRRIDLALEVTVAYAAVSAEDCHAEGSKCPPPPPPPFLLLYFSAETFFFSSQLHSTFISFM